ncbi:ABC transporter substrate-binding protein (plasmid) [Phyllobacterium zundukense]|uniref:ABC transporter substrate-binding protein n=1 Tax=Phyllobacterium zundukense TaxID=1867719 RepID=A0ACD4CVB1_9HYPH|nr:ABC transporter substrate-binding protein [Phyllobacterium zundukense]UXN57532.1 ABC transporter substrate-binding protein [Phyllobacterium zundukense]
MRDLTFTRRSILAATAAGSLISVTGLRFAVAQGNDRRTLKVGMSGFPPAVEPVLYAHTATRRIAPQMFDTLIAFDQTPDMALRPALAERWERVNGKAVRLVLRKGVTFHDGGPFTADDVAFSLSPEHLLGPDMAGKSTAMQTLDTIDKVEIVDSHTVIVHAKGDDVLLEKRQVPGTPGRQRRSEQDRIGSSANRLMSKSSLPRTTPIGAACRRLPAFFSASFRNYLHV